MEQIQAYRLFFVKSGGIQDNGARWGTPEMLRADFPEAAIIPVEEVPDNWRDMTVENGRLVPASAEVLEARREAEKACKAEAVRSEREARYRAETDPILFDAMEVFAEAHPEDAGFAGWLAAKGRIRAALPKPEGGGHE